MSGVKGGHPILSNQPRPSRSCIVVNKPLRGSVHSATNRPFPCSSNDVRVFFHPRSTSESDRRRDGNGSLRCNNDDDGGEPVAGWLKKDGGQLQGSWRPLSYDDVCMQGYLFDRQALSALRQEFALTTLE